MLKSSYIASDGCFKLPLLILHAALTVRIITALRINAVNLLYVFFNYRYVILVDRGCGSVSSALSVCLCGQSDISDW